MLGVSLTLNMHTAMSEYTLAPPLTAADQLQTQLKAHGFAVLSAQDVSALSGVALSDLQAFADDWADLPPDQYLKDGGRYRRRRHASLRIEGQQCQLMPHRAHWQPLSYNALHGGMQRWFEPMKTQWLEQAFWSRMMVWLGQVTSGLRSPQTWFAEAHQFRIDTTDGIGRPTPEGAHRDGVDLVAVFMVGRQGIKGGETRVFDVNGPQGQRFTLAEPWSVLLVDDTRVIHETTPIQPVADVPGTRDTLVITLRADRFLDDPQA